jgi:coxsackievirus/adenovirus receptor
MSTGRVHWTNYPNPDKKYLQNMLIKSPSHPNFMSQYNEISMIMNKSCFPPQDNLLIGRKKFLYASSTCGLERPEHFCVLGGFSPKKNLKSHRSSSYLRPAKEHFILVVNNNIQKTPVCEICDSRYSFEENINSHRIENVVKYNENPLISRQKWWQSENNRDNVYIQLDLEAEFILTRLLIKFKYYPPQVMNLEKSMDYGKTWQTLAYYATNCKESFPNISTKASEIFQRPICINRYSNLESRELIYRPLLYGKQNQDPYLLATHSKITNLRINFKQLFKLGDHFFVSSKNYRDLHSTTSKYYYAISELMVMGFCSCNGHATKCTRANHVDYDLDAFDHMVHARCECLHNTTGLNCERCLPLYNDLPWRSGGENGHLNECKKCECNEHATSCHFDQSVYLKTNGRTGGVCDNCMHNTEGIRCQRCKKNYYHDKRLSFTQPEACKRNLNHILFFQNFFLYNEPKIFPKYLKHAIVI